MSTQGNLFSTGFKSFLTNGSGTATGTGVTTLNGLSDVTLNSSQNQHVLMYNSTTTQWENHTIEDVVKGTGTDSVQIGNTSTNSANSAVNIGVSSSASGVESVALGPYSTSSSINSLAVGSSALASAERAVSIGTGAVSQSQYSTALGPSTVCDTTSDYSTSLGFGSNCLASLNGVAIGGGLSQATGAITVGVNSQGLHANSITMGLNSTSRSANSVQFGINGNSGSATMHFRSQKVCDEAFADGNIRVATIDASGNIVKSTVDPATLGGTNVFNDDVFRIRDNLDNTKIVAFDVGANVATGTTRSLTVPNATGVIVLDTATQTLTNKSITSPVISTIVNGAGTLTLPSSTDTIIGRATTDTLTNKTITATSNNVTANSLRTATSSVSVASATHPTSGQILTYDGTNAVWTSPSGGATTFNDNVFTIQDDVTNSKKMVFQCSAITSASTRTVTAVDASGVMCVNTAGGAGGLAVGGLGGATASGANSVGLGFSAVANQAGAIALGNASLASGLRSVAVGNSSSSPYTDGVAIGTSCRNEGDNSITIGPNNLNTGYNSIVLGSGITNITADVLSLKVGASGTLVTNLIRNNTTGTALPANLDWLTVTIGGVSRKIPLYS